MNKYEFIQIKMHKTKVLWCESISICNMQNIINCGSIALVTCVIKFPDYSFCYKVASDMVRLENV